MNYFGKFRIEVSNKETGDYYDTGFNDNVFLNKFFSLSNAASKSYRPYVVFGSGSSVPTINDTNLQSSILGANILSETTQINTKTQTNNVFKYEKVLTFEGTKGKVQGNISELGLSFSQYDSLLFTRSLVKDTQGNPTTISLGANDVVKLTYKIGYTVDLNTSLLDTQTINIGGVQTTVELHAAGYNKTGNPDGNFWEPKSDYVGQYAIYWMGLDTYTTFSDALFAQVLQGDVTDAGNFTLAPGTTILKPTTRLRRSLNADGTYINSTLANISSVAGDAVGTWNIIAFSTGNLHADDPSYCPVFYIKFSPGIVKQQNEDLDISGLTVRCGRT